jgi:hypothetical protein
MKRHSIFLILCFLLTTGCSHVFNEHLCSKGEKEKTITKLDEILTEWDDTITLASATPRIALYNVIKNMQDIKQELNEASFPSCSVNVVQSLETHMDDRIEQFISFASDESSYIQEEKDKQAGSSQFDFTLYYKLLSQGRPTSEQDRRDILLEEGNKIIEKYKSE